MTISQFMKGVIMGIAERKEREKVHRKEEILDGAQSIFFEKGLMSTTMDDIAEAAELSKGTLYLYYKSKEDLYLAVMMRGLESLYAMCEEIAASDGTIVQKLVKFLDAYKKFFYTDRKFFRMFNFFQTPQFHKQVSEEMKQVCSSQHGKLWNLVDSVLKAGMEEGLLRSDIRPIEITLILWSSATALMLRNDTEGEMWKERRNIDLMHTLDLSNNLLLESILSDKGYREYAQLQR
jgi:TetR/AcrR family transcriptional regulator